MNIVTLNSTNNTCPICLQHNRGSEAAIKPPTFRSLQEFGRTYFRDIRTQARAAINAHYDLPGHLAERATSRLVALVRKYRETRGFDHRLVAKAIRIVIRHDLLGSDHAKDSLAQACGADRLDNALPTGAYSEVQAHYNAIAGIALQLFRKSNRTTEH